MKINKKIVSFIMIVIGLPMALMAASSGGGIIAMFFTAILAGGIDLLTDSTKK